MKYFKTTESVTVDNYPYGYKQCEATFSLEFVKGKGFRTVFQSVDPKTFRLNKPKKSTYSNIIVMYQADNGHIKYQGFGLNGRDEINTGCKFLAEHFDLFTPEQISDIYLTLLAMLKVDMKATAIYGGSPIEQLIPLYEGAVNLAVRGVKEGINLFSEIQLDAAAIDATRPKNYQPFRVTKTFTIGG